MMFFWKVIGDDAVAVMAAGVSVVAGEFAGAVGFGVK
jgi:hypothetical protein